MTLINDLIYNPARALREILTRPSVNYDEPINFMGVTTTSKRQFLREVAALPYITYRKAFYPSKTGKTTDAGFGCLCVFILVKTLFLLVQV